MKKAKAKIPNETPAPPAPHPNPDRKDIHDPSQPWMNMTWADLVKLIQEPEPGHAGDVFLLASRRVTKLMYPLSPVDSGSCLTADDWAAFGDIVEMNICIMQECFEIVSRAWEDAKHGRPLTD